MSTSFRPSLTLNEIKFLLSVIAESDYPESAQIRRKLEVFTLKATYGLVKPSHIRTGKQSLETRLGMAEDESIEILFDAWNDPTKRSALSKKQLDRVTHHRYLSDMMEPAEEAAYEKTL